MTNAPPTRVVPRGRWILAAVVGLGLFLTCIGIGALTSGSGNSDALADSPRSSDQRIGANADPASSSGEPIDVSGLTVDAPAGSPGPVSAKAVVAGGAGTAGPPTPAPQTWQQEVAAATESGAPIRLTPAASDWTAENVIIGKDLTGKFIGRVTVRYSGPGSAHGTFAVTLLKDGNEITALTGELVEVRSGTYQVLLDSKAPYVDGPWTTQFRVVSTA